jgi:ABC-type hemin transport system substrate-binding protein
MPPRRSARPFVPLCPCSAPRSTGSLHRGLALLLLFIGGAACDSESPSESPEVQRGERVFICGREITRVVVALGAEPGVLGADTASRSFPTLSAAADLGKNCSDAPALAESLDVDVVLLDDNDPELLAELEARRIRNRVFSPITLDEVVRDYHELGALLAVETRAMMLVGAITNGISAIAVRRDGRTRVSVAWILSPVPDRDSWDAVGSTGLMHELLELAGAENAFHGSVLPRHRVSTSELGDITLDLVLDSTGGTELRDLRPGIEVRTAPAALTRQPILDPLARIEALHALLYPEAV